MNKVTMTFRLKQSTVGAFIYTPKILFTLQIRLCLNKSLKVLQLQILRHLQRERDII